MSEELPAYCLVKCNVCEYYFGKHKNSKISCPRCRTGNKNLDIVYRTENAEELHRLVSINNLPSQLRKEFEQKNIDKLEQNTNFDLKNMLPNILVESVNEEGFVTVQSLNGKLRARRIKFDALKLAHNAEFEGLLMRVSEGKWRLIG